VRRTCAHLPANFHGDCATTAAPIAIPRFAPNRTGTFPALSASSKLLKLRDAVRDARAMRHAKFGRHCARRRRFCYVASFARLRPNIKIAPFDATHSGQCYSRIVETIWIPSKKRIVCFGRFFAEQLHSPCALFVAIIFALRMQGDFRVQNAHQRKLLRAKRSKGAAKRPRRLE
jgi:hypothetical protein